MTTTDTKNQSTGSAAPHNPFTAFDPMALWNAFQTQMNAWTSAQPAAFNPLTAWTTAQQSFAKMIGDSAGRAQVWNDEIVAMETQMLARANAAIDTWAQLARDTLSYTAQLSAQARNLGMDAAKKATAATETARKATGA